MVDVLATGGDEWREQEVAVRERALRILSRVAARYCACSPCQFLSVTCESDCDGRQRPCGRKCHAANEQLQAMLPKPASES